MRRKDFVAAANGHRKETLDDQATLLLDGHVDEQIGDRVATRRIRVYRGKKPGEDARSSIGHLLVVSAQGKAASLQVETIPAGSNRVRHPSYDHLRGRGEWSVATRIGQILFPPEQAAGLPVLLGKVEIQVAPPEIQAVPAMVAGLEAVANRQ